nr:MAG TPA: tail tape measure protein [Caudoviricetes sp.]
MSAARQSGDISAAAFQRYQHEVQQTADKLVTLNIQNAAATERIAQMNASLAATEAVSNNAAEAVSRIGESAETTTEAARDVTRATQEVGNEAESAANQSTKAYEKIGSAAQKALGMITKAAITASAAASAAVGALAKEAIASFGDYEQLASGAQLMFGEAYDYIAEKAKTAFKDVQMSQNDYLEQVNGFAIGLKTAMGGDELGAAKLADRIVAAEADIVAATGNTAENVQNAFNGIMKSNYTMLDNLQIGITPTKEGFQELIDKVNAYKEAQGDATRYTIDNLADCQNALVDYIEMRGLAGYAQAEGADTLQGSMASMTAAWQNMLTGMADPTQDFDELISALIDSVLNFSNNLMPRIMAVLPQMATGIAELADGILPLIPQTLEDMLPDVISGANSLIAALLDTLSSIADTAIPIVTDNADEIIDTLLSGLISALPKVAGSAADLCTALITAILSNADIITQGAVDIITALAKGISDNLDTLIPAVVNAVLTITETLINNTDKLISAAEDIIIGLADGLINSLPILLAKAPQILMELNTALVNAIPDIIEFALDLCDHIADNIINYDWESVGADMYKNMQEALSNALSGDSNAVEKAAQAQAERIKRYDGLTQEQLDKMIADNTRKLGEWNDAFLTAQENGSFDYDLLPKWMQTEMDMSGETSVEKYLSSSLTAVDATIDDLTEARKKAVSEIEKTNGDIAGALDGTADVEGSGADSMPDAGVDGVVDKSEMLDAALKELEDKYAVHKVTEEEYWAGRKALLEQYRNEEDAEWWKLYDKVTEHYDKLADTETKAAEKAAKEAEQAKKDAENALKSSVEGKFREIETEQLEKGYDDSWLLEQERAFIETLDHNSEVYKDYNLKMLKEQKSTDDKAAKEAETAAKKQQDTLEKAYDSVVKSRDSLASSLKGSSGDIFNSSEETDKRTGAKTKSNKIDLSGFEKKLAAKKKLTSKIAELYEKNVPDSLITELLKQDPEAALDYATQLLKDPKKLSKIKSLYKDDEGVSNIIANMVTENSDEFEKLGTDAGTLFGDSFMEAFKANWEQSMKDVFDGNYVDAAAANVSAANSSAALSTNTSAANTTAADSQDTSAAVKRTSASSGSPVYKVVDLDGKYVAKVVAQENKRAKTASGG